MLGLTAEAEDLLDVLRSFRFVAIEDLHRGRDPETVDRAIDEIRRNGLASIHLSVSGRRVVSLTDSGRLG